jgi:hypothetical protein
MQKASDAEVLSPAGIRNLLAEKRQLKRKAEPESSLAPVVRSTIFKIAAIDSLCDAVVSHVTHKGMQLASVCAGLFSLLWTSAGVVLCTPWARCTLGSRVFGSSGRHAFVVGATAFGVLGAVVSSLLAVHAQRGRMGGGQGDASSLKNTVETAVQEFIIPKLAGTRPRSQTM